MTGRTVSGSSGRSQLSIKVKRQGEFRDIGYFNNDRLRVPGT